MKKPLFVIFMIIIMAASSVFASPSVRDVEMSMRSGNIDQTKLYLKEVLKEHPDSYKANFYMAQAMTISGDHEQAKKYSEAAAIAKEKHQREVDEINAKKEAEKAQKHKEFINMILGILSVVFIVFLLCFAVFKINYLIKQKKEIKRLQSEISAQKADLERHFKTSLLEINSELTNIHFHAKAEKIDPVHISDIEKARSLCADAIEAVFENHQYNI